MTVYSFFAMYEELTSLATDENHLHRLESLCKLFKKYVEKHVARDTMTLYVHLASGLIAQLAWRWYRQSGLGYGYHSMQGPE